MTDPFTHMEEAWKLERNPFPSDAIRRPEADAPFSPDVFPDETAGFYRKLIRGAVLSQRGVGFLWSMGPAGGAGDTGFGKTTLMLEAVRAINDDLGATILRDAGMKEERLIPIAAVYSNLNNLRAAGLYPVLFNAVVDAAKPTPHGDEPLFEKLRQRIVARVGEDDRFVLESAIRDAYMRIAPSGVPLRPELLNSFTAGGVHELQLQLSQVSEASRLRNGLQYFDFLMAVLATAEVEDVFVFIDQLEDLALNKAINSAKRSREIGRIRDLLEAEPYASRAHFVFTFHNTAANVLARFWEQNRLPRFEVAADNTAALVVLRGLSNDEQVAKLLEVYLADARTEPVSDPLLPFEPDALGVLRQVSSGRVGPLLKQAHELLEAAAQSGRGDIDGSFAQTFFSGGIAGAELDATDQEPITTSDIDDLLL